VNDVDGVRRTERLAQYVVDACALKYGTHWTTGDNTGTSSSGTKKYDTGSSLALYGVRNGATRARNAEESLLCFFNTLRNRERYFLSLAVTDADHTVTVTNDDECGEAKATTTLDDLGYTVDGDDALEELALLSVAVAVAILEAR
jgi:hypothetical protein